MFILDEAWELFPTRPIYGQGKLEPGNVQKFLIVEDQALIAMLVEDTVTELGHEVIGIAASQADAPPHSNVDIAFVDVNLLDGPTGPDIGRELAAGGVTVVFMTANPEMLDDHVPKALEVISKPLEPLELIQVINYAIDCRGGREAMRPARFRTFAQI